MTKPKHRYVIKRVINDGIGWEYNARRNMWEMWYNGKSHRCIAATTSSVIRDFINYSLPNPRLYQL